ncbi:MAG: M90 family metallopeptidase [Pseudohongiellaceae bacterium]
MDSQSFIALVVLALLLVAVIFYVAFWPGIRYRRLIARPFPESWLRILRGHLTLYDALPADLQQRLRQLIQVFIADKRFVGCAGLGIDDEVRVTIAAQACLLVLNQPEPHYPQLRSILVYPSTFIAVRDVSDELGLVSTTRSHLLGESWDHGQVVLAWDNVIAGVRNLEDGRNVVLHEFAHQLDSESGSTNGAPVLLARGAYKSWAEVFHHEYQRLQEQSALEHEGLLDNYGATDPAEFFAVATETFFERPLEMATHHQALYRELVNFYRLDPANWRP